LPAAFGVLESAKSLAAHLCGLCVALEHANHAATLKGIQPWLSANPKLQKILWNMDEPSKGGRALPGKRTETYNRSLENGSQDLRRDRSFVVELAPI
jgi:hypothetical protein